jgi:hypothetical protein
MNPLKVILLSLIATGAFTASAAIRCQSSSGAAVISFSNDGTRMQIKSNGSFPSSRLLLNSKKSGRRAYYRSGTANVAIVDLSIFATGKGKIEYKYKDVYGDHTDSAKSVTLKCN